MSMEKIFAYTQIPVAVCPETVAVYNVKHICLH